HHRRVPDSRHVLRHRAHRRPRETRRGRTWFRSRGNSAVKFPWPRGMRKHEAPSSKLEENIEHQASTLRIWSLKFGASLMLGAWCLELFTSCSVGPNYKRPDISSPSAFRGDASPTNISFADLDWWGVYEDPTLQALIREAFTNNYD